MHDHYVYYWDNSYLWKLRITCTLSFRAEVDSNEVRGLDRLGQEGRTAGFASFSDTTGQG
jgi:hypothetical protein